VNSDKIFSLVVPIIRPVVVRRIGATRRRLFAAMAPPTGRVVFLGDSITQYGIWEDLFPELPTTNRGIGGETTSDLLERLDAAIQEPLAVSLLIGTNDLHGPRRGRAVPGIAARTEEIVRRIRERAPEAPLLVNSVMPRTSFFAPRIRQLNELYREIAERHGATYVDLWPALADPSGHLRPEFTADNLHLAPAGYLAWAQVLRPHLARFAVR
jgi:lysophospholipase L1-like esterase